MPSNKMLFIEPVPLGTWQSSVLIRVKLLMFQVDVRFFRQGSVLIGVTSLLYMWAFWSQVASPTKFCCIVLGHPSRPSFSISVCCSFVLGFFIGLSVLFWLLFPVSDE